MSQRVTVELPDEVGAALGVWRKLAIAGSRMPSSSGFAKPLPGWRLKPCPTMNCIVLHGLASHRGCGRSLALGRLSGHGFREQTDEQESKAGQERDQDLDHDYDYD